MNINITQDELCEYCKDNIYEVSVNSGSHNLCEGSQCERALEMYRESTENEEDTVEVSDEELIGTLEQCMIEEAEEEYNKKREGDSNP